MNYTLVFHELSRKEYIESFIWYQSIQYDLGDKFEKSVQSRLQQITKFPERYSKKSNERFREAKVENFPFMIVYEIFPRKKLIHIASIIHTSRNPKRKYRRLK